MLWVVVIVPYHHYSNAISRYLTLRDTTCTMSLAPQPNYGLRFFIIFCFLFLLYFFVQESTPTPPSLSAISSGVLGEKETRI